MSEQTVHEIHCSTCANQICRCKECKGAGNEALTSLGFSPADCICGYNPNVVNCWNYRKESDTNLAVVPGPRIVS
jgi:hypothetical protein